MSSLVFALLVNPPVVKVPRGRLVKKLDARAPIHPVYAPKVKPSAEERERAQKERARQADRESLRERAQKEQARQAAQESLRERAQKEQARQAAQESLRERERAMQRQRAPYRTWQRDLVIAALKGGPRRFPHLVALFRPGSVSSFRQNLVKMVAHGLITRSGPVRKYVYSLPGPKP